MTGFENASAQIRTACLARQEGCVDEQAAILAYLRELAAAERASGHDAGAALLERCATAIERGEHYGPDETPRSES